MGKRIVKSLFAILIMSLLVLSVGYMQLHKYMDTPLQIADDGITHVVSRGSSLGALAYSLERQGVLAKPRWLLVYSRLTGKGASIQVGEYFLHNGITARQLLTKIERGDVQYYQVTLVEGWTLAQAVNALQQQPKLNKRLDESWQQQLFTALAIDKQSRPSLEGLFFPDTYRYHSGMSDIDILKQAYDRLQSVLAHEWEQRDLLLPYADTYEALIMASLIEKETGAAHERGQIAGVFVRRLQKGMRLQTDPTIIYGLGAEYKGNLRRKHLRDKSNRYNTYQHHGLTPTPIALVGREAIHAALNPVDGDTLFFVAKGDGTHYFSVTLAEHQKAVRKYQILERKKDYSSAPMLKSTRTN